MSNQRWIFKEFKEVSPIWRLGAAVWVSFLLHLLVLSLVRVGQVERVGSSASPMQVRLEQVAPVAAPRDVPQPVLVRAINEPVPRPEPPSAPLPVATAPAVAKESRVGMPEQAASAMTLDAPLPEDTTYYPAAQVDEHPSLVTDGRPRYPDRAVLSNRRGDVTVLMMLNEHGAVDEVSIVDVKPPDMGFEDAVIAWLRDARFKPAMRQGRAVKARVVYHVTFEP